MTRVVLRFQLTPSLEIQNVTMPAGSEVLSVGIKPFDAHVSLWALCPTADAPKHERWFYCLGTGPGWEVYVDLRHIGTVISESGFVWHVFERVQS